MTDAEDISGLEAALAERARKLSEEHLVNGRQARELMLVETRQRLQVEEEHAVLSAKARAERVYQQRVQAADLELKAGLDRLRWELINVAYTKLHANLTLLADDKANYLPLLAIYLRESAQAIERSDLVAQFNARDLQRLQNDWALFAEAAAPGKQILLSSDPLNCAGGLLLSSADHNIRIDNTFEGRMERMAETLQGIIAEQLTRQIGDAVNG